MGNKNISNGKITIYGKVSNEILAILKQKTGIKEKNKIVDYLVNTFLYSEKVVLSESNTLKEGADDDLAYSKDNKAIKSKDGIHLTYKQWRSCRKAKVIPWLAYIDKIKTL